MLGSSGCGLTPTGSSPMLALAAITHRMSVAAQRIEPDPRFEVLMPKKPRVCAFPTWGRRRGAPRGSGPAHIHWPFGVRSCRKPCQSIAQAIDLERFFPSPAQIRLVSVGVNPHRTAPPLWHGGASRAGGDLIAGGIVSRRLGDA